MRKILSLLMAVLFCGSMFAATSYTVAGDSETAFGNTWDPSNSANDMTLVEGLYTWEKADLTLAAGSIAFKVCEDHAWTVAYPESNYVLRIPESGIYKITITFNPSDKKVDAVAAKTGSAEVIPTVAMHGNFGGQDWADTKNFQIAEDGKTASLTLTLAPADYSFGMRIGSSANWTANGVAFTREKNSAVVVAGQGDLSLDADSQGDYTFTWTYASNTLTITYPEYVEPTYEYADGYYIIGLDMTDWTMEYMPKEGRLFTVNPEDDKEYQLAITLTEAQQFKVVKVAKDHITTWYPDGTNNNYVVDAKHAGEKTVYFRPDGRGGDDWHEGVIYVPANVEPVETAKFYVTGNAALVGDEKEWVPNAIKSEKDTLELDLEAGQKYMLKVTLNGTWEGESNVKGFDALTEKAEGLVRGEGEKENDNICFQLNKAGKVQVIYIAATEEQDAVFKLVGDFYVAPKVAYYLIGDSAFVVDAGATADKAWTPDAIPCLKDTTVLNLKKGVDYIMRLSLNGTWENHRDFRHLTDTAAGLIDHPDEYGNHSIGFKLAEDGKVTVIYIPATEAQPEVFKLVGDFYVYVPVLKDGYYLVGNKYDWTPAAERLFLANEENKGEYYLADVKLVAEDSLKVVYVEKDVITTWYPEGDNYVVDAKHEGVKSIYFRPDGRGGDDWYKGLIYIEANPAPKQYYAKYAPKWEWTLLTEKEGLWLTDTIVYGGIGINITDALEGEGLFYSNTIESARPIAGAEFAEKDTVLFSFNPADSILTATLVGKYVKPVVPMAKIRLVPGVWNVEGVVAKFAAVTWNVGETMEANGVVSEDWFVGTDTVEGEIPAAADSIAFARFNGETVAPTLDMRVIWNHSDKLLIDKKTMIYTISGWPEDGRNYSPGYWGEPPTYELKDGFYLVGNKYDWTPAAERLFLANEENPGEYYLAEIKLAAEDSLKVVYVEKDVIKKWYPEGDNYVVDAKHEGVKSIYFRPDGRGGDDWYKGLIYIEANPAPKQYFAKYAPKWDWTLLTEKEGKWLTDTIIYAGIGININDKAEGDGLFYSDEKIEGARAIAGAEFAEKDTVLFSFNPADSVLTAVLVGKYVKPEPSVSVFGTMTEPAWEVAIPFKMAEDQKSATLFNDNIKAGEYAFKLQVSGEWRSNGFRYHRGFPGAAGITKNEDANMTFVADQEGAYTFEWFFDNDSLAITYPAEVKQYYAKYAPKWEYKLLTEKEGLWLTDTIIYAGTGININDKAEGDGLFYSNEKIEGARAIAGAEFAEKDTVLFSFNPADSVLTATLVGKYVEPTYELKDGFYLVGNKYEWTPAAERLFLANEENPGEYYLAEIKLAEEDSLKVVYVEKDVIKKWYPEDENYVVDAKHEGVKTIYFRPDGRGGDDWYKGLIYIEANAPVETAKFYVTGNAALVGADKEWTPDAIASMKDTLTLNLEANVDYELKVTLNGTWEGESNVKGYNELTENAKGLRDIGDAHNIGFKLDQAGEVKVVYIAAANGQPEVFKLIGEFHDYTSGFDNIDASEKAVKLIQNGQVVILRGDKVYTIMGQKIQ